MKKAAAKEATTQLGTKRTCPKCALKFYDFNRDSVQCPKCGTPIDPQAELQLFRQAEPKKARAREVVREDDEILGASDTFESVDDLGDDEEESLEDLAVTEDSEDET